MPQWVSIFEYRCAFWKGQANLLAGAPTSTRDRLFSSPPISSSPPPWSPPGGAQGRFSLALDLLLFPLAFSLTSVLEFPPKADTPTPWLAPPFAARMRDKIPLKLVCVFRSQAEDLVIRYLRSSTSCDTVAVGAAGNDAVPLEDDGVKQRRLGGPSIVSQSEPVSNSSIGGSGPGNCVTMRPVSMLGSITSWSAWEGLGSFGAVAKSSQLSGLGDRAIGSSCIGHSHLTFAATFSGVCRMWSPGTSTGAMGIVLKRDGNSDGGAVICLCPGVIVPAKFAKLSSVSLALESMFGPRVPVLLGAGLSPRLMFAATISGERGTMMRSSGISRTSESAVHTVFERDGISDGGAAGCLCPGVAVQYGLSQVDPWRSRKCGRGLDLSRRAKESWRMSSRSPSSWTTSSSSVGDAFSCIPSAT